MRYTGWKRIRILMTCGGTWADGFGVYRLIASIRNLGSRKSDIATSENCRLLQLIPLSNRPPYWRYKLNATRGRRNLFLTQNRLSKCSPRLKWGGNLRNFCRGFGIIMFRPSVSEFSSSSLYMELIEKFTHPETHVSRCPSSLFRRTSFKMMRQRGGNFDRVEISIHYDTNYRRSMIN